MAFEKELKELEQRRAKARQMGGAEKIKKQHDQGKLTARERIDQLLDPDSFIEIGMLNHSDIPGMEEKTPADSKVAGYGKIDGRQVAVSVVVVGGRTVEVMLAEPCEEPGRENVRPPGDFLPAGLVLDPVFDQVTRAPPGRVTAHRA